MTIGTGTYTVGWSTAAKKFIAAIGWQTGSARSISSTASYYATGNSLIALYGWTANPLVEYYVIDYLGNYNPGSAGQHLRSFNSDGGTYNIYQTTRTNAPSILGTSTFKQCLSVRTSNRLGGTITLPIHIAAWRSKGLNLGAFDVQIMATEGYQSN